MASKIGLGIHRGQDWGFIASRVALPHEDQCRRLYFRSSNLRGVRALEFGSVLAEKDQDEAEANLLHARFASSLSRKGAFTFVTRADIDTKFNSYCARDEIDDTKYPLIVVGGKGSGKSAAISNWADHRASAALCESATTRVHIFTPRRRI